MNRTFYNVDMVKVNQNADQEALETKSMIQTYRTLVEAIIPRSPELAKEYGRIQYYGALDAYIEEYLIMSLNNNFVPLAIPTAQMLDIAAARLLNTELMNYPEASIRGLFSELSPYDQFLVINLILQLNIDLSELPFPFLDNQGYVLSITISLNRLTMLGYYSEWSGYGSTRLQPPDSRVLEYYPISWEQIGYPGPSHGYRALIEYNFS